MNVQVPADKRSQFYNRKSNTSLNIQVVVDSHMKIIDFVNRWYGSAHDSRIFHSSNLFCRLMQNPPDGHLLGDAGYPCYKFLLTPFKANQDLSPAELSYQNAHCATRNLIERTFGCWKSKFQCLKFLRLQMGTAMDVISACAVLWNFLLAEKDLDPDENEESEESNVTTSSSSSSAPVTECRQNSAEGQAKRRLLIESFFN